MVLPYKLIGEEKLHQMIDIFYDYVEKDNRLNHLFPDDMTSVRYKQKLFQTQFLGGPNLYNEAFGHPMLKMRHVPFKIDTLAKDAWLENMNRAMNDVGLDKELQSVLMQRYEMIAKNMVNSF